MVPAADQQPPMNPFILPMQRPLNPDNLNNMNIMPWSGGFYNAPQSFYGGPMQQQSLNSPWSGGFYGACGPSFHNGTSFDGGSSFYGHGATGMSTTGPVYQGMAPTRNEHHQNLYRPPSSGPRRNRRKERFRKAEPPKPYHRTHESSGAVFYDRSAGAYPGMARFDANNPGIGQVWRTPSKNLLLTDCNLT
jgi:hypothetical protein